MLILLMAFCDNLRRRVPLNFIALGLFVSGGIGDVLAVLGHVFNLPTLSLSASPFRRWWRGRCWAPWQCACSFLPRIRFFSGRPLNRFPQSQPRLDPPASVILAGANAATHSFQWSCSASACAENVPAFLKWLPSHRACAVGSLPIRPL